MKVLGSEEGGRLKRVKEVVGGGEGEGGEEEGGDVVDVWGVCGGGGEEGGGGEVGVR